MRFKFGALAGLLVSAAFAQHFEVGGLVGYGFYQNGSVTTSAATVDAGYTNSYTAGAVVCEDLYDHFSGEARYLYHGGHPFLSGPSFRANMAGESHTLTYDVLFHLRDRDQRLRPFAAAGIGGKDYVASGTAPLLGSAPQAAGLVHADQWKVVGDFGGGIKYRVQRHLVIRAEIRDYITPFPNKQIVPLGNGKLHGVLQEIVPMAGISYSF